MKYMVWLTVCIFCVASIHAQILISEVYYDSLGSETGGEAVELYNSLATEVDISGYVLKTASSAADATLPENAIIPAKGFYLIADKGFSTGKDFPYMPDADYEDAITLKNTDGGVALLDTGGSILDAVGWGDAANIDPSLFEGTPAPIGKAGESLQRDLSKSDTNNNLADFFISEPTLNSSSGALSGGQILFEVQINTSLSASIESIHISDEDAASAGIDIFPLPGKTKSVNVSVVTKGSAEVPSLDFKDISSAMKKSSQNATHVVFEHLIVFNFSDAPASYPVTITLGDASKTEAVNYLEMVALEIDSTNLGCKFTDQVLCEILGDKDIATDAKPTLRNIGNIQLDAEMFGTNFSSTSGTIGADNLEFAFAKDFSGTTVKLSTSPTLYSLGLAPGLTKELSFRMTMPSVKNGKYVAKLSLVGVSG